MQNKYFLTSPRKERIESKDKSVLMDLECIYNLIMHDLIDLGWVIIGNCKTSLVKYITDTYNFCKQNEDIDKK